MAKKRKIVEIEYDGALTPAKSKDNDGTYRGLCYDDNGKLREHAKIRDVDDDELRNRYAGDLNNYQPDGEDNQLVDAIANALTPILTEIFEDIFENAIDAAAPYVLDWAARGFKAAKEGFSRITTSKKDRGDSTPSLAHASAKDRDGETDAELTSYAESANPRITMTNEQSKTMFAKAAVRLMLLSMTEVVDENGKVVDRFKQEAYAKGLTSEDITLALNRILTENPEPMDARSLERLDLPFSRTLFDNSEYVPIDREHLNGPPTTDKNAHKEDKGEPGIKQSHTDSR
jgi:hypothetical protein